MPLGGLLKNTAIDAEIDGWDEISKTGTEL